MRAPFLLALAAIEPTPSPPRMVLHPLHPDPIRCRPVRRMRPAARLDRTAVCGIIGGMMGLESEYAKGVPMVIEVTPDNVRFAAGQLPA